MTNEPLIAVRGDDSFYCGACGQYDLPDELLGLTGWVETGFKCRRCDAWNALPKAAVLDAAAIREDQG